MDCLHANRRMTFATVDEKTVKTYTCKICGESLPEDFGNKPLAPGEIPAFGSGTAPTRRAGAEAIEAREKRWEKDMPAYKALRAQGLQPPRIDGSAELMANAETRFEVESGKIMKGKAKEIESTISTLESVTGKSIYQPNTTPVNL